MGTVWQVIRGINNVKKSESIPALKKGEDFVNSNVEKANVMAEHFAKVSSTANYSEAFRDHKERFEKEHEEVFRFRSNTRPVLNVDFTMSEVKKALKKGGNTAPGKDQLCYEMFRNLSLVSRGVMQSFFNLVWRMGKVLSSWRHAVQWWCQF